MLSVIDTRAQADARAATSTATSTATSIAALRARIYLPSLVVVAAAAVLVGIGWADSWGGARFGASMTSLRVVVAGPITLAALGVFLIAERVRPAQRRPLVARGHRHDLLFAMCNVVLVVPLITALSLSFAAMALRSLPWLVLPKMGAVPHWATIALIIVAVDGCNWFVHLANHRIRFLWRLHALHHSQEDMSVLTVFRTHPLIHVSYLVALLPGIVLLANGALTTTVLVVYGAIVAFAHSNTNLGFGPLGRIVVSPNYHRIHHRLDPRQDVNLGFALTVWDQIFHLAVFPTPGTIGADTGLAGRPLRVEQCGARPQHLAVFAAQLLAPFRPLDPATSREDLPARRERRAMHRELRATRRERSSAPVQS